MDRRFRCSAAARSLSGYNTVAGTSFGDSTNQRFRGGTGLDRTATGAIHHSPSANQFFASQAAQSRGCAARRALPQDSGVLALIASNALTLEWHLAYDPGQRPALAPKSIFRAPISSWRRVPRTGSARTDLLTPAVSMRWARKRCCSADCAVADAIDTTAQSVEIAAGAASLTAPLVAADGPEADHAR